MKHVRVVLRSTLRRYSPGDGDTVVLQLEEEAVVADILRELKLVQGEVGLVVMEGRLLKEKDPVPDRATLELYPLFGGG